MDNATATKYIVFVEGLSSGVEVLADDIDIEDRTITFSLNEKIVAVFLIGTFNGIQIVEDTETDQLGR